VCGFSARITWRMQKSLEGLTESYADFLIEHGIVR
jgi:hypothetical protein